MAGIAPETEKPNPVKPGDRWITTDEQGRFVERTRNASGDGWEEVWLDSDMPTSLARAHELLIELYVENRKLRGKVPVEAQAVPERTIAERASTSPTTVKSRPCGGCGKK